MKGVYILHQKLNRVAPNGIERKIMSQLECFQRNGITCSEVLLEDGRENYSPLLSKIATILPFTNVGPRWRYSSEFEKQDFIYFRRPQNMTFAMRRFLSHVKRKNPRIKIVMEIPTYPYDLEYDTIKMKIVLLKDRFNRTRLGGLIDRFAVVGGNGFENLWNIQVISFQNGYDVNSVRPRMKKQSDGSIHLGCIAMFMPWHGYERLLNGLIDYYQSGGKREIIIHIVGEGDDLAKYRDIARNSLLDDKVIFHGMLHDHELDHLYDILDFGVVSLAVYKIDAVITSALKSREFLARGIPIISGCEVDVLSEGNMPYYLRFPNDSSNINIAKIIEFYDQKIHPIDSEDITKQIRDFAHKKIDLKLTFRPIIEYLKS